MKKEQEWLIEENAKEIEELKKEDCMTVEKAHLLDNRFRLEVVVSNAC